MNCYLLRYTYEFAQTMLSCSHINLHARIGKFSHSQNVHPCKRSENVILVRNKAKRPKPGVQGQVNCYI